MREREREEERKRDEEREQKEICTKIAKDLYLVRGEKREKCKVRGVN